MPTQEGKVALLTGFALLMLFTSFGITVYHTDPHCQKEAGGKTIYECAGRFGCPVGVTTRYTGNNGVTHDFSCPFAKQTLICNYTAFVFTLFFYLISLWRLDKKNLTAAMLFAAIISIGTLIYSVGLMVEDVKYGTKYLVGYGIGYTIVNKPDTYIANSILNFFTACTTLVAVYLGLRLKRGVIAPSEKVKSE